jgi:hypothetical protein
MKGDEGSTGPLELDHSKSMGVVDPRCPRCILADAGGVVKGAGEW